MTYGFDVMQVARLLVVGRDAVQAAIDKVIRWFQLLFSYC